MAIRPFMAVNPTMGKGLATGSQMAPEDQTRRKSIMAAPTVPAPEPTNSSSARGKTWKPLNDASHNYGYLQERTWRAQERGDAASEEATRFGNETERKRMGAYNDAINDAEIDDITKQELFDLFNEQSRVLRGIDGSKSGDFRGGGPKVDVDDRNFYNKQISTFKAKVKDAREGKGIYAVRKVNQAERNFRYDMPGRSQLRTT